MIRQQHQDTGYVCGTIGFFDYEAKVLASPSPACLNGSRISQLTIRDDLGGWLIIWDRGWYQMSDEEESVELVRLVLADVEKAHHG